MLFPSWRSFLHFNSIICPFLLQEYSLNLRSTGVHGALLVLNQSFGPEELANCLNIPADDTNVRKHLMGELSALMINARSR